MVAVVIVIAGIVPRVRARNRLKDQTDALAAPTVIANPPQQGKTGQEIILPGNIYAYSDASLFARTDGYLSKWYFDIGAHVRQGQLLAIISSPEVDKQLLQARADLSTAEANAGLAKTNSGRYQGLLTQNAVSKQDTDTFVSQAHPPAPRSSLPRPMCSGWRSCNHSKKFMRPSVESSLPAMSM